MTYTAQICAMGRGLFGAVLDRSGIAVTSVNAEYDLCYAIKQAGLPDGPIQFFRGTTPSISFRSVHRAAGWRIATGDEFPRLVRRKPKPNRYGEVGGGPQKPAATTAPCQTPAERNTGLSGQNSRHSVPNSGRHTTQEDGHSGRGASNSATEHLSDPDDKAEP
jgi:hypothetical protein